MFEHGPHHSKTEMRTVLLVQVAALESEMAQTRALLLEQSKKRLQLHSKLNSLSLVDQLPAEIKTEIFYTLLNLNDGTDEGNNPLLTPFFLGKICRGWRDFIWSSPMLWTNLHLRLSKSRYESQTNLLRDWLSRTAKCPLFFHITTVDSQEVWISDPPMEILAMFASVSAQWREVEFFLPDTEDCFNVISATENSFPLLTTATARRLALDSTERQMNLFSTAPQLSALHLRGFYPLDVLAPWHQLREFTSRSFVVDEIRGFLHKVPNIIRCSFRDILVDNSRDTFDWLPVLDHLECLELWFDSVDSESPDILGPVKFPSLCEASLRGPFAGSSEILSPIMISFHSSHLLEIFTFGGTVTSDYDLIQVLAAIPSVKSVWLDFYDQGLHNELFTEKLLQRLYPPHKNILLPNLRSFTYFGPTSLNEHIHLFRDVLLFRFRQRALQPTELLSEQRAIAQIQSVTVTTPSKLVISRDIQNELDSLVQEGLELSLTSTFVLENTPE